jgi:pimeloyl-ACP methyl ester carboxylesterase
MSRERSGRHIEASPIPVTERPLRSQVATADGSVGATLCEPALVAPEAPLILCIHGAGCTGAYFDLAGNSLAEAAAARGMPTLLVDRPGHGASPLPVPGAPIHRNADAVVMLADAVRGARRDLAKRPVALIGHSFGGAVALLASDQLTRAKDRPVAICLSGIGDRHDPRYSAWLATERDPAALPPAPHWLFGPGRSYDWRGITALRSAAATWQHEELDELHQSWPARWRDAAGAVASPVHVRLAEYERIWEATPESIGRIARAFGRAPHVDAALALGGGHLYEAHLRGPELVASQLDFIVDAVATVCAP